MAPTRRDFLWTSALAGGAVSLGFSSCTSSTSRPLNILVLGGTSFVGPHQVRYALDRGHTVTLFNRGRTNTHLFPELEKLIGDRQNDLSRILARGIKYRPLPVTAKDILEYHKSRSVERQASLRAGITAEREAELLAAWHVRSG